jgi:kinesin family member 11
MDSVSLQWALLAERKDRIEDGNRSMVQRFRSQLTHQLDALHKTVSSSVMQQEDHLNEMEHDMQSFVSSKDEVIQSLTFLSALLKFCLE